MSNYNDFIVTGPKGETGDQGIQGIQGIAGTNGQDGVNGVQGIQGIQGSTGDTGSNGLQGLQGVQGDTGTNGTDGVNGATGDTGSQGIQGGIGDTGAQGIQGIQGDTGAQGIQGIQGETGDTGNTGLQGDTGTQGIAGDDVDHITRTTGDGSEGTTDVYTMYQDAGETESLGTFDVYQGADGGGLTDIVNDTTPQLGGNLDSNGKTLNRSSYRQINDASIGGGTHYFNYNNGDMQQLTFTNDSAIAFSGFVSGQVCTMIIDFVNGGSWTPMYPSALQFEANTRPVLTVSGTDRLMVIKDKDDIYTLIVLALDIR